jgi:hypothetical protein
MGIDHLFDDVATIKRRIRTVLTGGRVQELPAAAVGTADMRSPYPAGYQDRMNGAREEANVTHVTYTGPTTDVHRGDELSFAKQAARRFKVVLTQRPSIVDHHLKVSLEELQRDSGS